MTSRERVAFACYLAAAVYFIGGGLAYTFTPQFMPFHEDAADVPWAAVEPGMRAVLLALIRLGGAGLLATGATVLLLLFGPFRRGEPWARSVLPAIAIFYLALNLWAMAAVIFATDATPPVFVTLGVVGLVATGAGLTLTR